MCCCEWELIVESIQSVLTSFGIIGAGAWAVYIFRRQRENKPHIEFSADIIFHKKVGDWWIVELLAIVENKGKIQHKLHNLDFEFSSLEANDGVNLSKEYNNQVNFKHELAKGSYLKKGISYFFVEPGVKSKYSFITRVPENSEIVIFHTWFQYNNMKSGHVAEATKSVPNQGD